MRGAEPADAPDEAFTLADYERRARALLPPAIWDFIAGGAGEERTLRANEAAFERLWLLPRVLTGAGRPITGIRLLGRDWPAPIGVAPVAYHTLVHPEGEIATARGAARAGLPFVVSTFAGTVLEDIAAVAGGPLWLQLYCFRDRDVTRRLVERAEHAGFEAIVLTVDAPRLGRRLRDVRNDFRLPPGVAPANISGDDFASPAGHAAVAFDPALDWSVLSWLRSVSGLPIVLKGILGTSDARRAVAAGADAIVVSNHGGRQLDGSPATLEMLPGIVAAVAGGVPVLIDGGVRRGVDVLACLALGAAAVLVGRPVLHGLTAGGADGVAGVLGILLDELQDTMALTGVDSLEAVDRSLVAQREQLPHLPLAGLGTPPLLPDAAWRT
ncbi:alpha-hydroxy acid oxidase [Polymorphospora rubra]|uniref:Alpha-hydroxy-acid oxidizing enzyme n=1 Tax=Polymorphospora rubra TaxID=338584 RepID=A0A810NDB0_9ACTN|nr:alpha-hydroxy acid oxidase [Polymorphospora rubra]BCJ69483.1 alpha-hydroxy-acid oxidizing enzyme [Polymorphospora rubra]